MNDLHFNLPFLGSVTLGQMLVGGIALIIFGPNLPGVAAWAVKWLAGLGKEIGDAVKGAVNNKPAVPVGPALPSVSSINDAIASLHQLTEYAVRECDADFLAKVTVLLAELQKQIKGSKP
jgi:hypothetical protein